MLPEYLTMQEFECADRAGCFEFCKHAIQTLTGPGMKAPMYKIERTFNGDVTLKQTDDGLRLGFKERVLFHLDTALYTPF